jgi:hypothetical protein
MPNWTTNSLVIKGDSEQLQRIALRLASPEAPLDFNTIVPMPPILLRVVAPVRRGDNGRIMLRKEGSSPADFDVAEATEEEQGTIDACSQDNWYDWAHANWGTKWNACDVTLSHKGGQLTYNFNTAWDAPRAFYDALCTFIDDAFAGVTVKATANHEDGGFERIH